MSVRWNTMWRRLAKRFVVLGLVTLAPAVALARVPYQSKPRPAEPSATQAATATQAASATSVDPARPSATPTTQNTKTVADTPALPPADGDDQATAGDTCSATATSGLPTLGTTVHWAATPDEAGKLAEKEHKLVFLIQVSGNFARQEFT
jgi:hypothetical protein